MRLSTSVVAAVTVLLIAAGHGTAQTTPPVTLPGAGDGMAAPPPRPSLQLKRGGRITTTVLESWSRPRPDGNGFSGAIATPAIGSVLPRFFAKPGSNVVINSQLEAESVRVHLMSSRSTRARMLRVIRLNARRWQFAMPAHKRVVVRISSTYTDGGGSRARAELRRR